MRRPTPTRPAQEVVEFEEAAGFGTSSYIFQRNLTECLDYLRDVENHPGDIFPFGEESKRRDEVAREVTRRLVNCVGSAVALRNAVNSMYGRLHKDGSFPEFKEERRTRYDQDPIIQFIVCLRNHLAHVGPMNVRFMLALPIPAGEQELRITIGLDLRGLREAAKRWRRSDETRVARAYLNDLDEKASLFFLLLNYRVRVWEFYKWFAERENELQRERLDKLAAT